MSVVPTVSFDTSFAFDDIMTSDFQRITNLAKTSISKYINEKDVKTVIQSQEQERIVKENELNIGIAEARGCLVR